MLFRLKCAKLEDIRIKRRKMTRKLVVERLLRMSNVPIEVGFKIVTGFVLDNFAFIRAVTSFSAAILAALVARHHFK